MFTKKNQVQQMKRAAMLTHPEVQSLHSTQSNVWLRRRE